MAGAGVAPVKWSEQAPVEKCIMWSPGKWEPLTFGPDYAEALDRLHGTLWAQLMQMEWAFVLLCWSRSAAKPDRAVFDFYTRLVAERLAGIPEQFRVASL